MRRSSYRDLRSRIKSSNSQGDTLYILRIDTTVADRSGSTKTFIVHIGFRVSPARTSEFSVSAKRYSDSEDPPFCGRRGPSKNKELGLREVPQEPSSLASRSEESSSSTSMWKYSLKNGVDYKMVFGSQISAWPSKRAEVVSRDPCPQSRDVWLPFVLEDEDLLSANQEV